MEELAAVRSDTAEDGKEDSSSSMRELLNKINHPLLDVRSRALKSIKFKLNNNIISFADIIHERNFLIHLMEWFNFDEWNYEHQVLELLTELSLFEAAALTLVEVGGVEFLSQLRSHVDPSCQETIDQILENLLKLPPSILKSHTTTCDSTQTETRTLSSHSCDTFNNYDSSPALSHTHLPLQDSQQVFADNDQILSVTMPTNSTHSFTISSESGQQLDNTHMTTSNENGIERELFPWLQISTVDHHILTTTAHRLESDDTSCFITTCSFVENVLLNDFPPQLFLQRPAVLQAIFTRLEQLQRSTSSDLVYESILLQCLLQFTNKLKRSFQKSNDPLTFSVRDKLTLTSEQCQISAPSADLEVLSHDLLIRLKAQQLNVVTFCQMSLSLVVNLLMVSIDRHLPWLVSRSSCHGNTIGLFSLSEKCIELFISVSWLLTSYFDEYSQRRISETEQAKVSQCLDVLVSSLTTCLSKLRRARESGVVPHKLLRLLCSLSVTIAHWFGLLLHASVPVKQIQQLSPEICSLMRELITHPVINLTNDLLMSILAPYLEITDPISLQLYKKEKAFYNSFNQLYSYNSIAVYDESSEQLLIAEGCLLGLHFSWGDVEKRVVRNIVQQCSRQLCSEKCDAVMMSKCQNILLQLVSHDNNVQVRIATYSTMKVFIENQYKDEEIAHSSSLTRVISASILSQLSKDLISSSDELRSVTHTLFSCVINKMLTDLCVWNSQWTTSMDTLPYVECCASINVKMMGVVLVLLDHTPLHVRVSSLLRMLYSKSSEIRIKSFIELSKIMLTEEEDSSNKTLLLSQKSADTFHNLLISSTITSDHLMPPQTHMFVPAIKNSSNFKRDDIVKLISVLQSKTMDIILKMSALEQLTVILQDCSLHEVAIKEGLLTLLQDILHSHSNHERKQAKIIERSSVDNVSLLSPCLLCLQLLVLGNETVRRTLHSDTPFLLNLIKCSLIYQPDSTLVEQFSQLLALLVFSLIFQFNSPPNGTGVKVQERLLQHLHLPFSVESFSTVQSMSSFIAPSFLTSKPVRHRLWTSYVTAIVGGLDKIPYKIEEIDLILMGDQLKFGKNLTVDEKKEILFDLQCIIYTLPSMALVQSLEALNKSKSFDDILVAMSQLKLFCLLHSLKHHSLFTNIVSGDVLGSSCTTSFDVKTAFQTQLITKPKCPNDIKILSAILNGLVTVLSLTTCDSCNLIGQDQIKWLVNVTMEDEAMCLSLLKQLFESFSSRKEQENIKLTLLNFFTTIISHSWTPPSLLLLQILHQLILVVKSPEHYDLSVLQTSLQCLLELTQKTKKYTSLSTPQRLDWIKACTELMTTLREILWSFISERGTSFSSFMSKRVISLAATELAHLLYFVNEQQTSMDWISMWLSPTDPSLAWLHSLVHDRDTEVCCSGYTVLSTLCSQLDSCKIVLTSWTDMHTYGLLGACLDTGLDYKEYSWVRHQAINVFVSVLFTCYKNNLLERFGTGDEKTMKSGDNFKLSTLNIILQECEVVKIFQDLLKCLHSFWDDLITLQPVKQVLESSSTSECSFDIYKLLRGNPYSDNNASLSCIKLVSETTSSSTTTTTYHDKSSDEVQTSSGEMTLDIVQNLKESVQSLHIQCQPLVMSAICQLISACMSVFPSKYLKEDLKTRDVVHLLVKVLNDKVLQFILVLHHTSWLRLDIISVWIDFYSQVIILLHICIIEERDLWQCEEDIEMVTSNCLKLLDCRRLISHPKPNKCSGKSLTPSLVMRSSPTLVLDFCTENTSILKTLFKFTIEMFNLPRILNCHQVYDIFCCQIVKFLRALGGNGYSEAVLSSIIEHWDSYTNLLCYSLELSKCTKDLAIHALSLFNFFLSTLHPTSQRDKNSPVLNTMAESLQLLLDGTRKNPVLFCNKSPLHTGSSTTVIVLHNTGTTLCNKLVKCYESHSLSTRGKDNFRDVVWSALCLLVASSNTAKECVMKAGLLEAMINKIKSLNSKMSLDCVKGKIKVTNDTAELTRCFKFLQNLLHNTYTIKCSAINGGLVNVIHALWPLIVINEVLFKSCLQLLIVLSAHCPEAHVALVSNMRQGHSLFQELLKITSLSISSLKSSSKHCSPHAKVLDELFIVLTNCVVSHECQTTFKKANFLSLFLSLNPKTDLIRSSTSLLTSHWLRLLVNLTFTADGQGLLLRLSGSLDLLCDIWSSLTNKSEREKCAVILRNLCFYGPTKTALVTNDKVLAIFTHCLQTGEVSSITVSATAVWALLYNCTRLRSQLCNTKLHQMLIDIDSVSQDKSELTKSQDTDEFLCYKSIKNALSLLGTIH